MLRAAKKYYVVGNPCTCTCIYNESTKVQTLGAVAMPYCVSMHAAKYKCTKVQNPREVGFGICSMVHVEKAHALISLHAYNYFTIRGAREHMRI